MIPLRFITTGAVILLMLFVFSLYFLWSDVVGADSLTSVYTSAVSAISAALLIGGVIIAGDAAFLRRKLWNWLNRVISTKTGLSALLVVTVLGLSSTTIAGVLFRTVIVSTDKSIILVNHDSPGAPHNIGRIEANTERPVLLRAGTRLLGYRIVATECTGAYPPVRIPTLFGRPVPRIHIELENRECKHEVLENPVRTDRHPSPRQ